MTDDPKRAAALRYQRARERYIDSDKPETRLSIIILRADDYQVALVDCMGAGFRTKAEVKRYLKEMEEKHETE